jgi:hypothetical protein
LNRSDEHLHIFLLCIIALKLYDIGDDLNDTRR